MICTLLRKPLTGTIIQTLTEFGGGMNIDASRVGTSGGTREIPTWNFRDDHVFKGKDLRICATENLSLGRFPANLMVHVRVVGAFPDVVGATSRTDPVSTGQIVGQPGGQKGTIYQDGTLSASRFFKTLVK